MRAVLQRAIEAHKAEREENDEAGFSLIELIIVVVVLGILAAIAIPMFMNIQRDARDSAASAAAANGATQAAAQLAQDPAALAQGDAFANLVDGDVTAVVLTRYVSPDIDTICVTATYNNGSAATQTSGPGC